MAKKEKNRLKNCDGEKKFRFHYQNTLTAANIKLQPACKQSDEPCTCGGRHYTTALTQLLTIVLLKGDKTARNAQRGDKL